MEKLRIAFQAWSDTIRQKKEQEEKRIAKEQVAKARYWKIPICNDDDEDDTIAITPVLPTEEPDNFQSKGDEHLSTIPKTESDELIKSSDENLVPIPSKSEDFSDIESECDVPDCDYSQMTNFSTFSNPLFDDSSSSDDESSHEEEIQTSDVVGRHPLRWINQDLRTPGGYEFEVESKIFLVTFPPVIDSLLPFSSENKDKVFSHGVLVSEEKSPPSSSHRGFKASKLFYHKSPMLIHGAGNIPILDVPFSISIHLVHSSMGIGVRLKDSGINKK
ncbi:hypothetical protein Tco_0528843 [Tanacetum coccineum]